MGFGRRLLRLGRFTAWVAGIFAAIVALLAWLYPASQSKEPTHPTPLPIQSTPVVIVQQRVVIVPAAKSLPSSTYYRPVSETPSPTLELKEAPPKPQPKVDIAVSAHSPVLPKPRLSESSLGLLNAAVIGSHDSIKQWLARGADVNAVSDYGKTPLMLAAQNGHHDICRTLISKGARTDITDQRGRNALHYAAEGGHNDVVRFLLDHRLPAHAVDNDGKTPFELAQLGGHRACAEAIVKFHR